MDVDDVGKMRFCPACGRPLMEPQYESEDQYSELFDWREPRCSCCERPWIACPCTPAEEGFCKSLINFIPSNEFVKRLQQAEAKGFADKHELIALVASEPLMFKNPAQLLQASEGLSFKEIKAQLR